MRERKKFFLKYIFLVVFYVGLMFFLPIFPALYYKEFEELKQFLILGLLFTLPPYIFSKKMHVEHDFDMKDSLVFVVLIWILIPFITSIPFILTKTLEPLDAYFESVSGWTTTGFSMISNVESLYRSILFWRSLLQWIGGIGIVVAVLAGMFRFASKFYVAEAREEKILPNVVHTVNAIWWIYIFYTIVSIFFLYIVGMPLFDAINHTMTGISTGGMTVRKTSFSYYKNHSIYIIASIIMILGAISFSFHHKLIRGDFKLLLKDSQTKVFLFLIVIFSIILSFEMGIFNSIFQVVSAITATGFFTINIGTLSNISKLLLITLMFIGGCTGSTAGGLKVYRFIIVIKSICWEIKRKIMPGVTIDMRVGDFQISEDDVRSVLIFSMLYIIFIITSTTLIMAIENNNFLNTLFDVISAQSNVGLSVGIVSSELTIYSKILLIINMIVGRLEIWGFILIFARIFMGR